MVTHSWAESLFENSRTKNVKYSWIVISDLVSCIVSEGLIDHFHIYVHIYCRYDHWMLLSTKEDYVSLKRTNLAQLSERREKQQTIIPGRANLWEIHQSSIIKWVTLRHSTPGAHYYFGFPLISWITDYLSWELHQGVGLPCIWAQKSLWALWLDKIVYNKALRGILVR